ncbi:hypothetical protein CKAH01_14304 [Colletotrichum kahawae]|uniref:Uncharacterized protein n=1 Tax=Colletotrichum kahawae TaxID=34407 RepID=A0AAE0DCM8_COLKA|nr:hypothetical protein CKAH01_14304 [Colletotrichum kahawae]
MDAWLQQSTAAQYFSASKSERKTSDTHSSTGRDFNTIHLPLLDPAAFDDVIREIGEKTSSPSEFQRLLKEHSETTTVKLRDEFNDAADHLAADPTLLPNPYIWESFLRFSRDPCLQYLVPFISAFVTTNTDADEANDTAVIESTYRSDTTRTRATRKGERTKERGRVAKKAVQLGRRVSHKGAVNDRYNLRPRPQSRKDSGV